MLSTYSGRLASASNIYRATAEPAKAAQLGEFISGKQYLYLGVLVRVFGCGCVVYVLVRTNSNFHFNVFG